MKFTCTQENLLISLSFVTPVTGKNLSLPILNNILIVLTQTDIQFRSTNLELAITARVRGKVEQPGSVTVNGKLFHDFVALQPAGKILIELKDQGLHITSATSKTVIKTQPAEDFPLIPMIQNRSVYLDVDVKDFKNALQTVLPAVSVQESRPEISGVYLRADESQVVIAGTDSYRLAEYTLKLPKKAVFSGSYIVPLRSIQEVLRVIDSGTMQIIHAENQLIVTQEDVEIITRLIDGNYPDYKEIIPTEEKTTISVNATECMQAIKAASLFCKSGVNDIELTTKKAEKLMVVVAANNQVGENITTIPCVVTGDDTTVVFNYRYFLDALSTIPTDDAIIALNGPQAAGVIRPSDTTPLVHLIMPIRQ